MQSFFIKVAQKAELLYTLAQKKAEQEVKASNEKVNEAKEAWEKNEIEPSIR
jgi:RNase P subunit RPR2